MSRPDSTLIPTTTLKNGSTYSRQTSYGEYVYQMDVRYVSRFLSISNLNGINYYMSVSTNGTNALVRLVVLMNVKI
jgi:hypothetical protein